MRLWACIQPKEGRKLLLYHRALVNGRLSAAIVKGDKLLASVPVDELVAQLNSGQCLNTATGEIQSLVSQKQCGAS